MSAWTQKASKGNGGGFEKAPAGNHPAVLVAVIDMGHQWQDGFQGAPGKYQHRAYFVWELVCEKMAGMKDKNHVIALDLTISLNEKAKLRKWIEARTGKAIPDGVDYDISQELGQPCLLGVVMKGDYPKVDSVSGVPKGMKVDAPQNKPVAITLDDFKSGKASIPEFVPWLYGEALVDVINRCKEIAGDNGRGGGNAQRGPAKPTVGSNGGTTGGGATGATSQFAEREWWVDVPESADPKLMTEADLKTWASARNLKPEEVKVMDKAMKGGWRSAKDAGISLEIPF